MMMDIRRVLEYGWRWTFECKNSYRSTKAKVRHYCHLHLDVDGPYSRCREVLRGINKRIQRFLSWSEISRELAKKFGANVHHEDAPGAVQEAKKILQKQ